MVNFVMCIMQQFEGKKVPRPSQANTDSSLRQEGAEEGHVCIWPFSCCPAHVVIENFATCPVVDLCSTFTSSVGGLSIYIGLFTACLVISKTSAGSQCLLN